MDALIKDELLSTMDTMGWSLVGVTEDIKNRFIEMAGSRLSPEILLDIIKIAEKSTTPLGEMNKALYLDTSVVYNYLKKSSSVEILKYDYVKVIEPVKAKYAIIIFKTKKPMELYLENNLLGVLASKVIADSEDAEYEYCGFTSDNDEMIFLLFN